MKNSLLNACRTALTVSLSDAGSLRIQTALTRELDVVRAMPPKPIMTMDELIEYLRVGREVVEDHMGQIPCFELGGNLLFRKEAVDEWLQTREKNYRIEAHGTELNRILKFAVA